MIAANAVSVGAGLASGVLYLVHSWLKKPAMPKLEDVLLVAVAGMTLYSSVEVGFEMFSLEISAEQLAVVEMGCLALVYICSNEIYKRI